MSELVYRGWQIYTYMTHDNRFWVNFKRSGKQSNGHSFPFRRSLNSKFWKNELSAIEDTKAEIDRIIENTRAQDKEAG